MSNFNKGREEQYQRPVPEKLRLAVPARYGVEIVKRDKDKIDPTLIISDQLHNKHVDSTWLEDYNNMSPDDLKERIIDPLISFLTRVNRTA
jgi:hypothetical protein